MQSLWHKHIASLSALMMFAPLIWYQIDQFGLWETEKTFVKSYIHVGYIVIVLIVASVIIDIVGNYSSIPYSTLISLGCMCMSIFIMIYGSIMIIQDKSILDMQWTGQTLIYDTQDLSGNVDHIFMLLPIYNLYQRYQWNTHYLVKESIVLRTTYSVIISIIPNLRIAILGIFVIFSIMITHLVYPTISNKRSQLVQDAFVINIEEIYGHILWTIIYYTQSITNHILKKTNTIDQITIVESYQSSYQLLSTIQGNYKLIAEYSILALIIASMMIWYITQDYFYTGDRISIFASMLIASRYFVMFYVDQFVAIPIIHECVWFITTILTFIHNRHPDDPKNLA